MIGTSSPRPCAHTGFQILSLACFLRLSSRLPGTVITVFSETLMKGLPLGTAISSNYRSETQDQMLYVTVRNIPCQDPDCKHPVDVNINNNKQGWWTSRQCARSVRVEKCTLSCVHMHTQREYAYANTMKVRSESQSFVPSAFSGWQLCQEWKNFQSSQK